MRDEMVAWVGEHEDSPLVASVVVAQMVRLSQIALAMPEINWKVINRQSTPKSPCKVCEAKEPHPCTVMVVDLLEPSTKLDALVELLKDNPGKKFVVATSSKKMVYLAQRKFASLATPIGSFALTGDTPQAERDGMVQRFIDDDNQVFIGVIEAMAEGIDGLQFATDTMVFLDRSWKTIKNKQCEDRLHRGGTKDTVQIIDIMARSTVDFGRKQKLEEKWSWIKMILGKGFDNEKVVEAA
jgi:SNF2 family DNA or RNA helicase